MVNISFMIDKIPLFVYNPICGVICHVIFRPCVNTNFLWAFTGQHLTEERYFPMYEDKTLVCKDCGNEFVFTAGEQAFYAEKGFQNEPTRCKSCRDARKASRNNNAGGEREMFETVCAECGKPTRVPFIPKSDRPIYCSECYAAKRQ